MLSWSEVIGDNLKMVQKQKGNSGDPYLTDDDIKNIEYHDNKIVENIWGNSNGYNPNPNPNSKTGRCLQKTS